MRLHILILGLFVAACTSQPLIACSCVRPPPGPHTPRELAELAAAGADSIFEGKVERIELKWALLDAKVGDLVSADLDQDPPRMEVWFKVERGYRGVEQQNVIISTGLGSGDCGYQFDLGRNYLVYAFQDDSDHLSTSICSATAPVAESQLNLAYLRGEPNLPEVDEKNSSPTGQKVCGRVSAPSIDLSDSQVLFVDVESESSLPSEKTEIAPDGSFCATDVDPGRYKLLFISRTDDSPTSFVFFPGVSTGSAAATIEVGSDRPTSDLRFEVSSQPTFSVSGNVRSPNTSMFLAGCKVILLSTEPFSLPLSYSQDVRPDGVFRLPRVLPGKYWAFVTVDSDDNTEWLTRKTELDVNGAVTGATLELTTN